MNEELLPPKLINIIDIGETLVFAKDYLYVFNDGRQKLMGEMSQEERDEVIKELKNQ